MSGYPPEQGYKAAMATTRTCKLLNEFPKPTVALVRGACFGGGCGIVCCVDVAFATPDAVFGLTEVRVGVAPTPISTHMVDAMGLRHTRRYALTGERFDAAEACRIGLVHEVVAEAEMEAKLALLLEAVFLGAPEATVVTKRSFLGANGLLLDERRMSMLAHESWMQRCSALRPRGRKERPPSARSGGRPGTGRRKRADQPGRRRQTASTLCPSGSSTKAP